MPSIWDIIRPHVEKSPGVPQAKKPQSLENQEDAPKEQARETTKHGPHERRAKPDKRLIEIPSWMDD